MRNPLHILIEPRLPGIIIPLLIGSFLWIFPFFVPHNNELWSSQYTPLVLWLNNLLIPFPFLAKILGLLFAVFISFLLVQFNKVFSFIRIRSLLLFFFFMLLIGTNISAHSFNFSQLSLLFLLLTLWQLFSIYEQRQPVFKTFNIGFFIALGSFFSIEILLFTPILLIGINRLKGFTLRTFLATCLGLIAPFALMLGILYLAKDSIISLYIKLFFSQFSVGINLPSDYISIVYLLILCLIGIISILNILNDPFSHKIKVSRMLGVVSFGFIFFVLLFIFKSNNSSIIFALGTIFSTILYAHYFSLNSGILIKILFVILTIVCFIYYFSNLFSFTL